MNREIKFRAWDKSYKHWYRASLRPDGWTTHDTSINQTDGEVADWQQYTGLKDKNGKEIFEGDVLKCPVAGINKIIYHDGAFGPHEADWDSDGEVLGNIYENPELLTQIKNET